MRLKNSQLVYAAEILIGARWAKEYWYDYGGIDDRLFILKDRRSPRNKRISILHAESDLRDPDTKVSEIPIGWQKTVDDKPVALVYYMPCGLNTLEKVLNGDSTLLPKHVTIKYEIQKYKYNERNRHE